MIGTHYRTEFKEEARELTAESTQKEGLAEPNSEGSSTALHDLAVQPDIACKNVCQSGLKEVWKPVERQYSFLTAVTLLISVKNVSTVPQYHLPVRQKIFFC